MDFNIEEFYNAPLTAAIVSWLTAQIIKVVFHIIKYKKFDKDRVFGAGGMPSSHSATVWSLAIVVSRISGVRSVEFALAMVLAMVVMYDATGVRWAAGLHARELNRIRNIISKFDGNENSIETYEEKNGEKIEETEEADELKEFLGHTPLEVLCGALLGIIIGMAIKI